MQAELVGSECLAVFVSQGEAWGFGTMANRPMCGSWLRDGTLAQGKTLVDQVRAQRGNSRLGITPRQLMLRTASEMMRLR